MTSVFSFRPEHFNQNGDQENLAVLEYATGTKFEHVDDLAADLLLFGDAPRAAMREFEGELAGLVPSIEARLDAGLATLLIGSCYEFFAAHSPLLPDLARGARVSAFVSVKHEGFEAVGYRNSEVLGSELFLKEGFIGTLFFGPLLAKNPELLKLVSASLGLALTADQGYWDDVRKVRENLIFG